MNYIALTIGPIYKTLQNAKKTREIWGASYFFSYVVKQIIIKIKDKDLEFITPFVDENKLNDKNGVGLFHDRIIVKSSSFTKDDLDKIVKEVLQGIEKQDNKLRYNFLKNYLQIYTIQLDEKEIINSILDINPYLDSAELFYQAQLEETNLILNFVKNRLNGSFLSKDAFSKKTNFESLPEIALSGFDKKQIKKLLKDDELEIYENDEIKKELKPYHRYIAIVQADGDNMGAVLKEIGDDDKKREKFSKALFEFCIDSTNKVKDFEGRMIYAGGDDLLFFTPIVSDGKTVFHLVDELGRIFDKKIATITNGLSLGKKPTLSFGVSITYYKYPLYEARQRAVNLLFDKAKKEPKNQVAFYVTKHSGQSFEGIIKKDVMFKEFLEMISFNEDLDANFLHSIYSKIDKYKIILKNIKNDKDKIDNFFDNYFNEELHKTTYKTFIDSLKEFVKQVYANEYDTDFIYSTLRFKKFLLGDKK